MIEVPSSKQIFRYLNIGVIIGTIVVVAHIWFFKPGLSIEPFIQRPFPSIKIDFEMLQSQKLQDLSPFEEISPPVQVGRENPFASYPPSISTSTPTSTPTTTSQ